MFYLPDTEFLQWVDGGHLLNLIGENGVDEEKLKNVWDNAVNEYFYNPETFQLGRSEGAGMFALPKDQGPFTLAYNIDLVNQRIAANRLEDDEEVKALIAKHGADRLSEVPETEYAALLADAEVLG